MSKRILVVEHDEATLEALGLAFRRAGLEPVSAPDAATALVRFREATPSAVLIAVGPGQETTTLVADLRKERDGAIIPVLFMGEAHLDDEVRSPSDALAVGGDYFFKLPTDLDYLAGRVLGWTGESNSTISARLDPAPLDLGPIPFAELTDEVTELTAPIPLPSLPRVLPAPVPHEPVDDGPTAGLPDRVASTRRPASTPRDREALEMVKEGERLRTSGHPDAAIEAYAAAAEVYEAAERIDPALALHKLIVHLDPTRLELAQHAADLARAHGKTKDAIEILRRPAKALEAAERFEDAAQVVRTLIGLSPSDPALVLKLASLESKIREAARPISKPMNAPLRALSEPPAEPRPQEPNHDDWDAALARELALSEDALLPPPPPAKLAVIPAESGVPEPWAPLELEAIEEAPPVPLAFPDRTSPEGWADDVASVEELSPDQALEVEPPPAPPLPRRRSSRERPRPTPKTERSDRPSQKRSSEPPKKAHPIRPPANDTSPGPGHGAAAGLELDQDATPGAPPIGSTGFESRGPASAANAQEPPAAPTSYEPSSWTTTASSSAVDRTGEDDDPPSSTVANRTPERSAETEETWLAAMAPELERAPSTPIPAADTLPAAPKGLPGHPPPGPRALSERTRDPAKSADEVPEPPARAATSSSLHPEGTATPAASGPTHEEGPRRKHDPEPAHAAEGSKVHPPSTQAPSSATASTAPIQSGTPARHPEPARSAEGAGQMQHPSTQAASSTMGSPDPIRTGTPAKHDPDPAHSAIGAQLHPPSAHAPSSAAASPDPIRTGTSAKHDPDPAHSAKGAQLHPPSAHAPSSAMASPAPLRSEGTPPTHDPEPAHASGGAQLHAPSTHASSSAVASPAPLRSEGTPAEPDLGPSHSADRAHGVAAPPPPVALPAPLTSPSANAAPIDRGPSAEGPRSSPLGPETPAIAVAFNETQLISGASPAQFSPAPGQSPALSTTPTSPLPGPASYADAEPPRTLAPDPSPAPPGGAAVAAALAGAGLRSPSQEGEPARADHPPPTPPSSQGTPSPTAPASPTPVEAPAMEPLTPGTPARLPLRPLLPAQGNLRSLSDVITLFAQLRAQRSTGLLHAEGLATYAIVHGEPAALRGEMALDTLLVLLEPRLLASTPIPGPDDRPVILGRDLVQRGKLRERECFAYLHHHLELGVLALLRHRGPFRFETEGADLLREELVPEPTGAFELLVDLLPWVVPGPELLQGLGGPDARLRAAASPGNLTGRDARFAALLDGQHRLEDGARLAMISLERAAALGTLLVGFGRATVVPAKVARPLGSNRPEPAWMPLGLGPPPPKNPPLPVPEVVHDSLPPAPVPHAPLQSLEPKARLAALAELVRTSDYFTILGVDHSAHKSAIDQAHHRLRSLVAGPEHQEDPESRKLSAEVLRSLDEARDVLKIPELRSAYLRHLKP